MQIRRARPDDFLKIRISAHTTHAWSTPRPAGHVGCAGGLSWLRGVGGGDR